MEDVVAENDHHLGYDHHTYDSVDVTKTVISDALLQDNQTHSVCYHDNGACANYEEPVIGQSQFESSQNGVSRHAPLISLVRRYYPLPPSLRS